MGFERLIRAYMVLIFAGDCWKRRELLQCQFWSIEFRIILSIFWGWSILISFCFVQVLEHCLWRGEGVGCALVVDKRYLALAFNDHFQPSIITPPFEEVSFLVVVGGGWSQ